VESGRVILGLANASSILTVTYAQYFTSFGVISVLVAVGLMAAAAHGARALLLATFIFMAAAVAYFTPRTHTAQGPGFLRSSVVAIVAIMVGAAIAYWRRNARSTGGRLAGGVLAWLGILFAWFETAYLLRSR
jgi:hydrogenase/urease accessory protein HupE